MKKISLMVMILFMPFMVFAKNNLEVESHIIDSNIEIAGALNVKELIIVKGSSDYFSRKLNYYSYGVSAWDGKSKTNFEGSEIYNAHSVSISDVAVFKLKSEIDINNLAKDKTKSLKAFDLTKPSSEGYNYIDNKDGTGILNIMYDFDDKYAIYINYTINNLVVKHNDIKELNYTFKNLDYNSKETIVRVITPYQISKEDEKLYNVYLHGSRNGQFQELVNSNNEKLGIYGVFKDTNEFNVRMTLPQEYVGVDMYLNNSKEDALDKIVTVEKNRQSRTNTNNSILNYMIYVFIGISCLFLVSSILMGVFKIIDKRVFILLFGFSLIMCLFNYLFYGFKYWYIYLNIIIPFIGKLINKVRKS